jgi:hypothetical protein
VPSYLALLWAWSGAFYHLREFERFNPAALWFGIVAAALIVTENRRLRRGSPAPVTVPSA